MRLNRFAILVGCIGCSYAFQPLLSTSNLLSQRRSTTPGAPGVSQVTHRRLGSHTGDDDDTAIGASSSIYRRLLNPTIDLPNHQTIQQSGLFGPIKKIHNPITYFALGIAAGFRWSWCFRNPLYWFAIAFTVKWYRARYIFKIPVWDRQPNWNNVITSKDQEEDLKAYTCKNCGSTIFIAKSREFFFEGTTGLKGLGCFNCGAKGEDNFVMDRDRIVEDVGDMDDYFEYERPLDLVSRAEKKRILKETKGDEELANKLLIQRSGGEVVDAEIIDTTKESVNGANGDESLILDGDDGPKLENGDGEVDPAATKKKKPKKKKKKTKQTESTVIDEASNNETPPASTDKLNGGSVDTAATPKLKTKKKRSLSSPSKKRSVSTPKEVKPIASIDLDELDDLGMDI